MRDLAILFAHLITTICKLMGPSGARSVVAESLLVKQQLLIVTRSRQRAPKLNALDRIVFGLCALFMHPDRIYKSAIATKPTTILSASRPG